ncbi:hypothetical protein LJR098_006119 [Rhizobium sp. LjRoot98]|uniref:hypothetical protein n=1 Tax=unclassified Rhizobium TaxID=2613769 RepID=UPI000B297890|nr:hypothetical protein [Rhizobium sp. Root1204]
MASKSVMTFILIAFAVLTGCASTASDNTTYAQSQGLGPDATVGGDRSSGLDPGPDQID